MRKNIGIIGGMGPLATYDLMKKILDNTKASCDQDYPRIIVDCNTNILDRTANILGHGESPLDEMVVTAQNLEKMGAEILCLPCNTAHYYFENIEKKINVPIINMIEETILYIKGNGYRKVLLLATEGTYKSKIYDKYAMQNNIDLIHLEETEQQIVMDIIYRGVKASNWEMDIEPLRNLLEKYKNHGIEGVVLGCTELPMVFEYFKLEYNSIDPTMILAVKAVEKANFKLKNNSNENN